MDLIIDWVGSPGARFPVKDLYYRRSAYLLAEAVIEEQRPIDAIGRGAPKPLSPNPVARPEPAEATRKELVFQGGAMGGLREARYEDRVLGLRELAGMGLVWAVDGRIIPPIRAGDPGEPMLRMKLGRTQLLSWVNETVFDHPMHLHGHSFHLLARNGRALDEPLIMDTVLIPPRQSVEVAFVADNPGDWALHCHVLEHASAGMMGYVRIE
jgi:FtsP/CotA-like multicopper oxidase with cupredoxin domain